MLSSVDSDELRTCSATVSKLVVFDSGLVDLKLPILRPLSFGEQSDVAQRHRDALSVLLERYFEWQAEVQVRTYQAHASIIHTKSLQDYGSDNEAPSSQEQEHNEQEGGAAPVVRSLTLRRCGEALGDDQDILWRWAEVTHMRENGRPYTTFEWEAGHV
ncbi:hypothetical protein OH77DRAFT_742018 [Trametes cingulata]|nr:hypothetical protein OH77DRAFT_742018 [Trametes cingulata]